MGGTLNGSEPTISSSSFRLAIVVSALLGLALAFRLYGIADEPFWHDEVFSVAFSSTSIAQVLGDNARDVHPPLYYLGLFFWRQALGDSDDCLRAYSTVWSLVGLLAVLLLARDIAGRRAAVIALALGAVNPQHIYFAQEARMYSQAAALCALAAWCLWRWMTAAADEERGWKGWRGWALGYTVCVAAALYTHYLTAVVLVAQGLFALVWLSGRRCWSSVAGYATGALLAGAAFLPWFLYVRHFRTSLYHPALSWIKAAPVSDYFSFLGREFFWGQVRTIHQQWWMLTTALPCVVLGAGLWRAWRAQPPDVAPRSEARLRTGILFSAWLVAGVLALTALCGLGYHPIYFRQRFSIFLLAPFLVLAGIGCVAMRRRAVAWLAVAALGAVMLAGTWAQYRSYQKIYWDNFAKWRRETGPPACTVCFPARMAATAPASLKPSLAVVWKSDVEGLLPQLRGKQLWICSMIGYGYNDRKGEFGFYQWLLGLGSLRTLDLRTGFYLHVVTVGEPSVRDASGARLDRWYAPVDIRGRIEGFDKSPGFHVMEAEGTDKAPFRWSRPRAWFSLGAKDDSSTIILNAALPPPAPPGYRPGMEVYARRGRDVAGLFDGAPVARVDEYRPGAFEIQIAAPAGLGRLWIGWTMNGVNLKRAGASDDDRDLGLRINWVGVMKRAR